MDVLVGCEFSGIVREAFKEQGHNAWSCDLLPTEIPGQHIQDDIRNHLNNNWDLGIFFPPCTFLTNSGVVWLYKEPFRWVLMVKAALFFKSLLDANIPKISVENPIMHKHAKKIIKVNYSQIIQPYRFGYLESKSTCLWLKNLPLLKRTNDVEMEMIKLPKQQYKKSYYQSPSDHRWKDRSRTYPNIARAMAEQWS